MKHFLRKFFFALSPLFLYTISGNSMLPEYKNGDLVFAFRVFQPLKKDNVIILTHPQTGRLLIKRIQEKKGNKYFVVGDNEQESTDSRDFGWVERKNILGKVLYRVDKNLLH